LGGDVRTCDLELVLFMAYSIQLFESALLESMQAVFEVGQLVVMKM
jgi:hypothetical protein